MFASLFYFFNCRTAAAATAAVKLNKKSEAKAADEFQANKAHCTCLIDLGQLEPTSQY